MHVLLVEDDPILADGIKRSLRQSSYTIDWVSNGSDADRRITDQSYDAVVLDLGLPGMDGLEVLRRLRKRNSPVPVLILTARDSVQDKVTGLVCPLAEHSERGTDAGRTRPSPVGQNRAGRLTRSAVELRCSRHAEANSFRDPGSIPETETMTVDGLRRRVAFDWPHGLSAEKPFADPVSPVQNVLVADWPLSLRL